MIAVGIFTFLPRPTRTRPSSLTDSLTTLNILLIGKDARALNPALDNGGKTRIPRETNAHSDIVIIAHLNLNHPRLNLVAIPRDLLVMVPGVTTAESRTDFHHMEKLTHTFVIGGEPLLRQTIANLLGIKIHRSITLDFDTFRMLFRYLTRFLGPLRLGKTVLNDPDQALKFVRQRDGLKYDDLDRCRNTLNLIKTVAIRLWPLIGTRIGDFLLDQTFTVLGTDIDLTPVEAKYLLGYLRQKQFSPQKINLAVLVSEGRPVTLDRYEMTLSCYLPIYPEIARQVEHFLMGNDTVPALDFMTQQHYSWPAYMMANYNLLPNIANDTLERKQLVKRILQSFPLQDSARN